MRMNISLRLHRDRCRHLKMNYSQIDRERAAIVFRISKFHRYIYSRQVELSSDHQPLEGLLGEEGNIPATASKRIQR